MATKARAPLTESQKDKKPRKAGKTSSATDALATTNPHTQSTPQTSITTDSKTPKLNKTNFKTYKRSSSLLSKPQDTKTISKLQPKAPPTQATRFKKPEVMSEVSLYRQCTLINFSTHTKSQIRWEGTYQGRCGERKAWGQNLGADREGMRRGGRKGERCVCAGRRWEGMRGDGGDAKEKWREEAQQAQEQVRGRRPKVSFCNLLDSTGALGFMPVAGKLVAEIQSTYKEIG